MLMLVLRMLRMVLMLVVLVVLVLGAGAGAGAATTVVAGTATAAGPCCHHGPRSLSLSLFGGTPAIVVQAAPTSNKPQHHDFPSYTLAHSALPFPSPPLSRLDARRALLSAAVAPLPGSSRNSVIAQGPPTELPLNRLAGISCRSDGQSQRPSLVCLRPLASLFHPLASHLRRACTLVQPLPLISTIARCRPSPVVAVAAAANQSNQSPRAVDSTSMLMHSLANTTRLR